MTWPATPPCPACLAFQAALGFPAFSHSTRPLTSIAPAGSCEAWRDTRCSLQCLHRDPSLSLPPFPTPLPNSSVPSWRPFPAAVPDHHPQGFEPPGAQGSGQRCEGPASQTAAHAIWGFFMWSLRPASPQPTPHPLHVHARTHAHTHTHTHTHGILEIQREEKFYYKKIS